MLHAESLAENRLESKRNAVKEVSVHRLGVGQPRKPGKQRPIRSPLQEVFLRRVKAEMEKQKLTGNQLAHRVGAPPQTTLNDVLLGADPRLETVYAFATALGVPAVSLLTESVLSGNVHNLPHYPKISGSPDKRIGEKAADRKKRRA